MGATLSGVHERDPPGWRRCGRGWVRNAPSRVPPVFPRCAPGVPGSLGGVGGVSPKDASFVRVGVRPPEAHGGH